MVFNIVREFNTYPGGVFVILAGGGEGPEGFFEDAEDEVLLATPDDRDLSRLPEQLYLLGPVHHRSLPSLHPPPSALESYGTSSSTLALFQSHAFKGYSTTTLIVGVASGMKD